ncbi:MAG TPA: hypothetical protein VMX58_02530 [Patescibacteria group bacterium]|nr:hypothetical protein [Patescibacteria group bacterium]
MTGGGLRTPVRRADCTDGDKSAWLRSRRIRWARLIRMVWRHDPLLCPRCGGAMGIISFITDRTVIDTILRHIGFKHPDTPPLRHNPPPRAMQGTSWVIPRKPRDRSSLAQIFGVACPDGAGNHASGVHSQASAHDDSFGEHPDNEPGPNPRAGNGREAVTAPKNMADRPRGHLDEKLKFLSISTRRRGASTMRG